MSRAFKLRLARKPGASILAALTLIASASCQAPERREEPATSVERLNTNPKLGDFALYAEESITIGSYAQVLGGDIGVAALTPASFGTQLVVSDHVQVGAGRSLLSPSTALGAKAQVGDVETNTFTNGGATVGSVALFPGSMPAMPLASRTAPAGSDVTVAAHQQVALSSGSYGKLNVGEHAQVTLAAGTYSFSSVTIGDNVQITAAAGVSLHVSRTLSFGASDHVQPVPGATSDKLVISVAGGDGGAAHAVSIGQQAHVTALVLAPNGTVELGSAVQLTGAVAAFDISIADHAQVTYQSGFTAPSPVGSQRLSGYFDNPTDGSFSLAGPVAPDTLVHLDIGLPGRDPAGLKDFVRHVSDPKDPAYRHYLTFDQLNVTYGATDGDYAVLEDWATAAGFTIVNTFHSGLLLGLRAPADIVEQALHVNLVLRNRIDGSGTQFITTDREPSVDLDLPIRRISGLDEYRSSTSAASDTCGCSVSNCCHDRVDTARDIGLLHGTQGGRLYGAQDIRNAYLGPNGSSCLNLDGTGQVIGLLVNDGWDDADITGYQMANGLPIRQAKANGTNPGPGSSGEPTLDIEMAFAMAPGADVVGYVASTQFGGDSHYDALWSMTEPFEGKLITTASTSYGFTSDDNEQRALDVLAAEGVSFFVASGDYGAQGDPADFKDLEGVTIVGGTFLLTKLASPGAYPNDYYFGDNTWNAECPFVSDLIDPNTCTTCPGGDVEKVFQTIKGKDITGGGIMNGVINTQMFPGIFFGEVACGCFPGPFCCGGVVGIPSYQVQVQEVSAASNGGSVDYRNYPDVAMLASDIQIFRGGGPGLSGGTSAAAPLWAGFAALVNQAAQQHGVPPLGFANPVLYEIGITRGLAGGNDLYKTSFNDVADGVFNGNNLPDHSTCEPVIQGYASVPGYDLTTGWGTPTCGLIQQLSTISPLVPQTFDRLHVHVATGNWGPALPSIITLDVFGPEFDKKMCTFVLKSADDATWNNGTVSEEEFFFKTPDCVQAGPIQFSDIDHVVLHYDKNTDDILGSPNGCVGA